MIQTTEQVVTVLAVGVSPQAQPHYPNSFKHTITWAEHNRLSPQEAQERFMHIAVLRVLAGAPRFRARLVLRGAGAMYLFYGNQRPTADIDLLDLGMPPNPSPAQCRSVETAVGKCLAEGLPSLFPNYAKWGAYLRSRVQVHVSPRRSLLRFGRIDLCSSPKICIGVADLHFLISEKIVGILSRHWPSEKARGQDVADIAAMVAKFGDGLHPPLINEYFRSRCTVEPRLASVGFDLPLREALASAYNTHDKKALPLAIPFDKAWDAVLKLARQMAVPVSDQVIG